MEKFPIPENFRQLQSKGCLDGSDIVKTRDGFYFAYKPIAEILARKGILDFPDSEGRRLSCSSFFDDWFLYAVPEGKDYAYSLLKFREQEHDMSKNIPADGDTPGVTVCFIAFDCRILLECIGEPSDAKRQKLNAEINRVVARRGQRHHAVLKDYFVNPQSEGAYLAASLYTKHIASFAENGCLKLPDQYMVLARRYASGECAPKDSRIPRFIEALNTQAGIMICDTEQIYIRNPENPDPYETAAILATHTGNTDPYSFAAEVEYHARFLVPIARIRIPFIGKTLYDSAIRADMTIGDTEFEGPAPFHRPDSSIVMRQRRFHSAKENRYEEK